MGALIARGLLLKISWTMGGLICRGFILFVGYYGIFYWLLLKLN